MPGTRQAGIFRTLLSFLRILADENINSRAFNNRVQTI
jgi:hypothetical protein